LTPSAFAVSRMLTPCDISSAASPRSTTRFSAFDGRTAAFTCSATSQDIGNGFPRGPG
jgi:hypothetical protein